jgi:hypothetical protein
MCFSGDWPAGMTEFSECDCGYGPYCQRNATFLPKIGPFTVTFWLHSRRFGVRLWRSIVVAVYLDCVRLF